MITGQEENIRKCLSPQERAKVEAEAARKILKREREEQKIFSNWLELQRTAGKLSFVCPQSNKASTIRAGWPDYTILLKDGRVLLIEMKVDGGKLSPEQDQVILELLNLDHPVLVAWGHVQAIKFVQLHLSAIA